MQLRISLDQDEEIAQWLKNLPTKLEGLSSAPRNQCKCQWVMGNGHVVPPIIAALGGWGQDPWSKLCSQTSGIRGQL